ncbi:hypothetical protein ISCGN_019167 [Ixodes scapularis]
MSRVSPHRQAALLSEKASRRLPKPPRRVAAAALGEAGLHTRCRESAHTDRPPCFQRRLHIGFRSSLVVLLQPFSERQGCIPDVKSQPTQAGRLAFREGFT